MKMIVLGPAMSEPVEKCMRNASPAAGRFLRNLLNGFHEIGVEAEAYSYLSYAVTDPAIDDMIRREAAVSPDVPGTSAKAVASPVIRYIRKDRWIIPSVYAYQRQVLEAVQPGNIVLFYNMFYGFWGLADKVRKKGAEPVLLFADYTDSSEVKSFFRRKMAERDKREFRKFAKIVTLSDYHPELFREGARHIVLRGGIAPADYRDIREPVVRDTITVMYAGLLAPVTGVDILLRAFASIRQNNVRLVLSGKGPLEDEVRTAQERDPRIHYVGFLDQADYYRLLNEANIFVNPRNMELPENRNNFPSKVLEYLATGRIVVSSKFSGYQAFTEAFRFYDGAEEGLAQALMSAIESYPETCKETYQRNKELAKRYSWNEQCRKILELAET